MVFVDGDQCGTSNNTLSLRVDVVCNKDATTAKVFPVIWSQNQCNASVKVEAKEGCTKVSVNALWRVLNDYRFLWGAGLIVLGLLMCFVGRKMIKYVLFIFCAIGVAGTIVLLSYSTFYTDKTSDVVVIATLVVGVLIGLVLGWYLMKFTKTITIPLLTGWGAALLGLLLGGIFRLSNVWALYALVLVMFLIGCFVGYKVKREMEVIVSAFIGAYFLMKGIGMYAGGFPNEIELASQL